MKQHFSVTAGDELCDMMYRTAVAMRVRTSEISTKFSLLGETFVDDLYQKYASDVYACEKQIDMICQDMGVLYNELKRYTIEMAALIGVEVSSSLNTSAFYEDSGDGNTKTHLPKKL